ncbi:MAG: hypothetical protein ACP5N3_05100 [Candidatus Nanoarchaeia archaeon]
MDTQSSELVVTGVDRLVDLLKRSPKIEISEVAKKLGYPQETVQSWVDFLVEEKIVGIEYNFTRPTIYLIESKDEKETSINLSENFKEYKSTFQNKVKARENDSEKAEFEWKDHILNKLELMKQFFFTEAERRRLKDPEKLWEVYKKKVIKA